MTDVLVDAHHHVWDLTVRDQDWITGPDLAVLRRSFGTADLRPDAEAAGAVATALVQTVVTPDETPELLALAAADPLVGAVVGWVDLTAPSVADDLARLRTGPDGRWLRGVRHQVQGEPDPEWLCRPEVLRGLRAVADAGLVTEADRERWRPGDLVPYADVVLEAFGAGRVMFGSDWPVCLVAATYGQVVDVARQLISGCSDTERGEVLAGTAAGVYGLSITTGDFGATDR